MMNTDDAAPQVSDGHPCRICGKRDHDKPMCYRNEPWCCGKHRKQVLKRDAS